MLLSPVRADVLDIAPDGQVTRFNTPGVFGDGTYQPLAVISPKPKPSSIRAADPSIEALLDYAASRYALNPKLLNQLAWTESRYKAEAVSAKGAVGVMQLMGDTARDLGVDRTDLVQNILGGAAYLREMLDRYGGNTELALAAYNAGPGAVDRHGGVPPFAETEDFVGAIMVGLDGTPGSAGLVKPR